MKNPWLHFLLVSGLSLPYLLTSLWFQWLTYIWWYSLSVLKPGEWRGRNSVVLHLDIFPVCWMYSTREVIGEQSWAGLLLGNIQWGMLHAGERFTRKRDLGKANQGVLQLKGWPSFLFLVKQELQGGSCPPVTLTVNRSRLAETLLFFPLPPSNWEHGFTNFI